MQLQLEKPNDIRQKIINVAKTIILGKGFSAVGLNEILTAAAVPKGSFYHYFSSKEQFGNALLEDHFNEYHLRLSQHLLNPNLTPAQRLHAYFVDWFETQSSEYAHDKCLVVKLSAEVTDLSEPMRLTLQLGTQRVIQQLQACIQEGKLEGLFKDDDSAEAMAKELYYMWLGATLLTKVQRTHDALGLALRATEKRIQIVTPLKVTITG